jgi:mannose-6-phosphate isomerase-like protein (cupin superfamily)
MSPNAPYTHKNLKEIDSSSGAMAPDFEIRFARSQIDSEHLGVSLMTYAPGYRPPIAHHHGEQEEAYVVISGSGRVKLDDEIVDLAKWDVLRVAPAVIRSFEAGPDGMEIIAIGADRPEGGDGKIVRDWWVD